MGKGARLRESRSESAPATSTTTAAARIEQRYSGPIPIASEFQKYEDVLPGAADRILKMSEDALKAEIEAGRVDRKAAILSLVLGRGFLYALLATSIFLIVIDKPVEALLAGLAPIVATFNAILRKKK